MADQKADQTPEARLVAALNLVGIDQKTWDGAATKEAKSALFNTKKDKKLDELKKSLESASPDETKKPIQDNIDLLDLASKDLSTPDDTKNSDEPPPIEPKKNQSDSGAKSWYDIMVELMEGPELDDYKDAGKKMEAICNRLRSLMPKTTPEKIKDAQRELYFAADKAGQVNKKWIEENGPMGNKIEDAVIKNEWRKAALVKEHAIETQRQEKLIEQNIALNEDAKIEAKKEIQKKANEEIQKGMTPTQRTEAHRKAEAVALAKAEEEKAAKDALENAGKELQEAKANRDLCKAEFKTAQEQVSKLTGEKSVLYAQNSDAIVRLGKVTDELQVAEGNRKKSATAHKEMETAAADKTKQYLEAVENTRLMRESTLEPAKAEWKTAQRNLNLAEIKVLEAENAVKDDQTSGNKKEQLQAELDGRKELLKTAQAHHDKASETLTQTYKQIETLMATIATAKESEDAAKKGYQQAKNELNQAQEQVKQLEKQLQNAVKIQTSTQNATSKIEADLKKAAETLATKEQTLNKAEANVVAAEQKLSDLKKPKVVAPNTAQTPSPSPSPSPQNNASKKDLNSKNNVQNRSAVNNMTRSPSTQQHITHQNINAPLQAAADVKIEVTPQVRHPERSEGPPIGKV